MNKHNRGIENSVPRSFVLDAQLWVATVQGAGRLAERSKTRLICIDRWRCGCGNAASGSHRAWAICVGAVAMTLLATPGWTAANVADAVVSSPGCWRP